MRNERRLVYFEFTLALYKATGKFFVCQERDRGLQRSYSKRVVLARANENSPASRRGESSRPPSAPR